MIGEIAGSVIGASSARSVNRSTINFMREQGQNRHQWEVDDLRAAGLNPMLSLTKGFGGGGSPAAPNLKQPFSANDAKNMAEAVKTAVAQTKNIQADTDVKTAQADNVKSDTILKNQQTAIAKIRQITEGHMASSALSNSRINAYKEAMHKIDSLIYSGQYGEAIRVLEKPGIAGTVGGSVFAVKSIIQELIKRNPTRVFKPKGNKIINKSKKEPEAKTQAYPYMYKNPTKYDWSKPLGVK